MTEIKKTLAISMIKSSLPVKYVLRDERVNLNAITYGFENKRFSHQIIICRKRITNQIGPFLLHPKITKSVYKQSRFGKEYQKKNWLKNSKLKFIAYIDAFLHIKISPDLFRKLHKNDLFPLWESEAPLEYFKDFTSGYLVLLRAYEIYPKIKDNLKKIRAYYYTLPKPYYVKIDKPVLDEVKFNIIKDSLIEILMKNGWLINIINNSYCPPEMENHSLKSIREINNLKSKESKKLTMKELFQKTSLKGVKRRILKTTSTQYYRDPEVRAFALRRANGYCECCNRPAPFIDKEGSPYLESHHLISISVGGEDSVFNVCGVCPNCHREMHSGINSEKLIETTLKEIEIKTKKILKL